MVMLMLWSQNGCHPMLTGLHNSLATMALTV